MDILIRLYTMFTASAQFLASYIPQNKEDIFAILRQLWGFLGNINIWLGSVLGIDIQKIINSIVGFIFKYIIILFNFLIELIKTLAERA